MQDLYINVRYLVILFVFSIYQSNPAFSEEPSGNPLEIKIGVILPLSGDMAAVGAAGRDAVQMALSDSGPTLKHRYKVIFEDDRLVPTEVAKAAQKLLSIDKVSGIISTWSYGGTIVSPMTERAHIPHIGIAWDNRVADGDFNFLHLTPPSEFMRLFLEVFKRINVKRVALLGVEESGSVFALDEFIRLAPNYGIEVVFRDSVLWDLADFNTIVTKIVAAKPDYLVFNLGGESLNSKLLKSLNMQKVPFKFTAITSFDVLGDTTAIEGLWYVSDSFLPEEFGERFQGKYGHQIRYGVGNFYEAMRLLIRAFEETSSGDATQAKDALLSVKDLPSIFGPTSVNPSGIFTYPAQYVRITKGKRARVTQSEIKE